MDTISLLARGLAITLLLTLVSTILSLIMGIIAGTFRLSRLPILSRAAGLYVEIFRNIPALVLIIFFAFALPNLFPPNLREVIFFNNALTSWGSQISGLSLPYYALAAILGLSINTSAYLAEIFRAGVGTIPQEIIDTSRSLGATQATTFWQILLPQGIRAAFPAISTKLIHNLKNTALASFVAVPEVFHATQSAITQSFLAVEFLIIAAVIYWLLSFSFTAFLNQVDRRLNQILL